MNFEQIAGSSSSPVILHVPHDSRTIPSDVRASIMLDDPQLESELDAMTDAHTATITARAVAGLDPAPWQFVNRLSRLVIDPERFLDEREEMLAVGMGAVYTRTSGGAVLREPNPDRDNALIARYFEPYAAALTSLVADRLEHFGNAVILDVHSFPAKALTYELHGEDRRPAVCLGVDPTHTPAWLVDAAATEFAAVGDVAVNEPFAGTYVPDRYYNANPSVLSLMLEFRRDTYQVEPGGPMHDGAHQVEAALRRLLGRIRKQLA